MQEKTVAWTDIDTKNQFHHIHQCIMDLARENTVLKETNARILRFVNNLGNEFEILKKRFDKLQDRLRGQVY